MLIIAEGSSLTKTNFLTVSAEGGKANFTFPAVVISPVYLLLAVKSSNTGAVAPYLNWSITR